MTLNMPKWNQMSWKKSKISQTFAKSLAVMHVSVTHMLQTWKLCEKCKKYKRSFVLTNFFEAFEPRSLTPYNLRRKLYSNLYISLSYINLGSFFNIPLVVFFLQTFRALEIVILRPFWASFYRFVSSSPSHLCYYIKRTMKGL